MRTAASVLARVATIFVVIILLVAVATNCADTISNAAAKHCPSDTFTSGTTYSSWRTWAVCLFVLGPFFALMNVIARFPPFTNDNRKVFCWRWNRYTISALALFVVGSGMAAWTTSASQICLANSGIYDQALPWMAFRHHRWADVSRVAVECRNRGKEPDLFYTLTMKDGTSLEMSDALNDRVFPKFQSHLANVKFAFDAHVYASCPEWLSGWVGRRP